MARDRKKGAERGAVAGGVLGGAAGGALGRNLHAAADGKSPRQAYKVHGFKGAGKSLIPIATVGAAGAGLGALPGAGAGAAIGAKKKVAKNYTVSAFGVEHGEVSKALPGLKMPKVGRMFGQTKSKKNSMQPQKSSAPWDALGSKRPSMSMAQTAGQQTRNQIGAQARRSPIGGLRGPGDAPATRAQRFRAGGG